MNQNSLLQQLRETTAPLHEQIEQKNPAQAILEHSMDLAINSCCGRITLPTALWRLKQRPFSPFTRQTRPRGLCAIWRL